MLGDRVPRSPPGYSLETFSTTQQPTPGNGLVTIIRQTAAYYCLNLNTPLQALAIRIQLHKQYTVCNIYMSPNEVIPPDSLAQLINQLPHPFLPLSDFNGKHPIWGCNSADGRGATVEAAINDTNSCILKHIHWQSGTVSAIDLSICSPDAVQEFIWEVMEDAHGSDNYPISLTDLRITHICRAPKYNLKKADWKRFSAETRTNEAQEARMVEEAVDEFNLRRRYFNS